jgi:hypothetical protein
MDRWILLNLTMEKAMQTAMKTPSMNMKTAMHDYNGRENHLNCFAIPHG